MPPDAWGSRPPGDDGDAVVRFYWWFYGWWFYGWWFYGWWFYGWWFYGWWCSNTCSISTPK